MSLLQGFIATACLIWIAFGVWMIKFHVEDIRNDLRELKRRIQAERGATK